jgi:hypothetical protein
LTPEINAAWETPDKEINALHIDITELSGKKLIQLARLLNAIEPIVMTRKEILETAAKCFEDQKFDRSFLFTAGNKGRNEEEIAASRKLLVELWKKRLLHIVPPSA